MNKKHSIPRSVLCLCSIRERNSDVLMLCAEDEHGYVDAVDRYWHSLQPTHHRIVCRKQARVHMQMQAPARHLTYSREISCIYQKSTFPHPSTDAANCLLQEHTPKTYENLLHLPETKQNNNQDLQKKKKNLREKIKRVREKKQRTNNCFFPAR